MTRNHSLLTVQSDKGHICVTKATLLKMGAENFWVEVLKILFLLCGFLLYNMSSIVRMLSAAKCPRGYFQIRRSGGAWTSHQVWRENLGQGPGQVHQIRGKRGKFCPTGCKSWEKVPLLGSYLKFRGQNLGYLSLIFLKAKFGAPTRISEANFGAKPPPPHLLIWKYSPRPNVYFISSARWCIARNEW